MKLAAIACVVGFCGAAALAQTSQTSPTLAETWVGTWVGKATWHECSLEGGDTLTMPIQSLASKLTSDGDILMDGLGALEWRADGKRLVIARDGLDVSLTPGKKGVVKLVMTTGAGCVAKASLKRATSGIPSCDAVRALATAKSTCDGLDEATRDDDLAEVDSKWKGWKKLKGKKKKAQARACTARLSGMRTDIASCAPAGGGTVVAGGGCAGLLAAIDKVLTCSALPQDIRTQINDALGQWKQLLTSLGDAQCDAQFPQLQQAFSALGCPI